MKKIIRILLLLLMVVSVSKVYAGSKTRQALVNLKNSSDKEYNLMKQEINGLTSEITGLKMSIGSISTHVKSDIKATGEIKADISGYRRDLKQSAGRDSVYTDPKLIIPVFSGLILIILVLLKGNRDTKKQLFDIVNEKRLFKGKYYKLLNGGKNGTD